MRWNTVGFLGLIFLMLSIPMYAQDIEVIDVTKEHMWIPPESLSIARNDPDEGVKILSVLLSDLGFLNNEVSYLENYQYEIKKGCVFVSDLELYYSDNDELILIPYVVYRQRSIEEDINGALLGLVNMGYYFAEANVRDIEVDRDECYVRIRVDLLQNERVYLSGLLFTGNRLNSEEYLTKRSYFSDSLLANTENLERLSSNIRQTELFESVSDPQVFIRGDQPIISYQVRERALNQFDGVLGYVPDATGNGQIVGHLSLSLWSVFADGNGVDLNYRRLEPEVSRLNLGVSQHWFGSVPLGLSTGFNFFQNDTTYQARDILLDGYFELGGGIRLIGDVGFTSITGSNISRSTIEPGGTKQSASFGFRYSSTYGNEVPREGFNTEVRFGFVNKSADIDSISAFSQQFIKAHAENYIPIGKQGVIASRLNSFFIISDDFTDIDLIRFGGANSLRGFMEEQFQASQLIWGDVEYRFLTNPSSYLFGFAAAGWFHRPKLLTESNTQFRNSKFVESLGFGLSYKVRIGRLKFTYAISPSEGLGNGKIHVGITTSL